MRILQCPRHPGASHWRPLLRRGHSKTKDPQVASLWGSHPSGNHLRAKGFMALPFQPPPPTDVDCAHFWASDGTENAFDYAWAGDLFGDGSCSKQWSRAHWRAGSAMVEIDSEGKLSAFYSTAVWSHLPQTSPCAEHLTVALLAQFGPKQATPIGIDYSGTVDAWTNRNKGIIRPGRPFAGLLRDAFSQPCSSNVLPYKVPAHKDAGQFAHGSLSYRQAVGNDLADEWAAKGRLLHPWLSSAEENANNAAVAGHRDYLTFVAKRLAKWALEAPNPYIDWKQRSDPALLRAARPQGKDPGHMWAFSAGKWRCSKCSLATTTKNSPWSSRKPCSGTIPFFQALAKDQKGHDLFVYEGTGSALLVCLSCGAWADHIAKKLWGHCDSRKTRAGESALKSFAAKTHPTGRGFLSEGRSFLGALAELDAHSRADDTAL